MLLLLCWWKIVHVSLLVVDGERLGESASQFEIDLELITHQSVAETFLLLVELALFRWGVWMGPAAVVCLSPRWPRPCDFERPLRLSFSLVQERLRGFWF